jgi:DNA-directed RNA polymerase II subunit RPB4
MMAQHAPTSRPKPPPPIEEEAGATLKLGEFQDADTLTLSEANLVIEALLAKRDADRKDRNVTEYVPPRLWSFCARRQRLGTGGW